MRRTTLASLTAAVCFWGARPAGAIVPIRDIRLTLDRTTYSGPCPVRIPARIVLVSNVPGTVVEDDWGWNFDHARSHAIEAVGAHFRTTTLETAIAATLTLPPSRPTLEPNYEGPVSIGLASWPTISNSVRVSVRCTASVTIDPKLVRPVLPGPTIASGTGLPKIPPPESPGVGPAVHLPDLVAEIVDPATGRYAVRNTGDGAAGPSSILLRCRAITGGNPATRGGCPALPAAVAALYDAALDGIVMPVPALVGGGSHTFSVAGMDGAKWAPGKYEVTAIVDVRGVVHERNEGNNTVTRTFTH